MLDSLLCLYLLKGACAEPEDEEDVVVRHEGVSDADNDQSPLREEEDRLATEMIGQRREDDRAEYDSDDQYRLRQVLEVLAITDQIPLKKQFNRRVSEFTRNIIVYFTSTSVNRKQQ